MSAADSFSGIIRAIKKRHQGAGGSEVLRELREGFVSCMLFVPANLRHDLGAYFCGVYAPGESTEEISLAGEKLLEVIYLFEEEYDRIEETLSAADWRYIRDTVSDFGMELEQGILMYVMREVVARGLIE